MGLFAGQRGARIEALAGALVWLVIAPSLYRAEPVLLGPIQVLLLFAVLVVVPLAFALTAIPGGDPPRVYRAATIVQPFAAAGVAASFLFPPGRTAAILASPWLLFTALAAAFGLLRLYRRKGERLSRLDALCIDLSLMYLPVGARWLLLARAGVQLPKVPEPLVSLTAIHFHYTFFTATLLTGLMGRVLVESGRARAIVGFYKIVALGVIAGPPLVAVAINVVSVPFEAGAAVLLATSMFAMANLTVFVAAPRVNGKAARALLTAGSVSLMGGMVLAGTFAAGRYLPLPAVNLLEMVRFHGVANALFALGSVAGWHAARRED